MNKHSVLAGMIALVCAAILTLAGCGGGGAVSVSKFCKDGQSVDERFAGLDEFDIQKSDLPQVKEYADAINKIADEAPSQIKDDLKTLADGLAKVAHGKGASVDEHTATEASDRIDAYVSDHCPDGN